MRKKWMGLLTLVLLAGCIGDEFDTDLLVDDIDITAGLNLKLATAEVTMGDILSDQEDAVKYYKDEDGNDRIMFFQDEAEVSSIGLDDLISVSIPPLNGIPVPYVTLNDGATQAINGQEVELTIDNATLSEINLGYNITVSGSNLAEALQVTLTLPTEDNKELVFNVYNGQAAVQTSTGDLLRLNSNKLPLGISVKTLDGGTGYTTEIGYINISMTNLEINSVKGTMGETAVKMNEGTYDLDFDVLEDIPGDIEFADPRLTIFLTNTTLFNGIVTANLVGEVEDGDNVDLALSDPIIMKASDDGTSKKTANIVSKENSNLQDFVAKTPQSMSYSGMLKLNPGGEVSKEIELDKDDKIAMGYGVEVPLDLKISNAAMDEEEVELKDFDITKDLKKAKLVVTSENGFPFSAKIDIDFYDEETNATTPFVEGLEIVKGAPVDDKGLVVEGEVEEAKVPIPFNADQIELLNTSEKLLIKAYLTTTDYESKSVVFLKQNKLKVAFQIMGQVEQVN